MFGRTSQEKEKRMRPWKLTLPVSLIEQVRFAATTEHQSMASWIRSQIRSGLRNLRRRARYP
jgi:hypothetical protein